MTTAFREALEAGVREHLRKTGETQKEFARRACVTLNVMKNALNGGSVTEEKLRQICEAAGLDYDQMSKSDGEPKAEMRESSADIVAKINGPAVRLQELEKQVALLEKTVKGVAEERDAEAEKRSAAEAERESYKAETEKLREKNEAMKEKIECLDKRVDEEHSKAQDAMKEGDEAVKQMYLVMKERDDANAALERASVAVQGHKARADAMELELLRLKAKLYDKMVAEEED